MAGPGVARPGKARKPLIGNGERHPGLAKQIRLAMQNAILSVGQPVNVVRKRAILVPVAPFHVGYAVHRPEDDSFLGVPDPIFAAIVSGKNRGDH